jgi:hypothetical protein
VAGCRPIEVRVRSDELPVTSAHQADQRCAALILLRRMTAGFAVVIMFTPDRNSRGEDATMGNEDRDRAFWERKAAQYDRVAMGLFGRPLPRVLELTAEGVSGAEAVLEVGAGTGLMTAAIAPRVSWANPCTGASLECRCGRRSSRLDFVSLARRRSQGSSRSRTWRASSDQAGETSS